MDKIALWVGIGGGIILALPGLIHAIRGFMKAFPGDPGDAVLGKIESDAQAVADVVAKIEPPKQ